MQEISILPDEIEQTDEELPMDDMNQNKRQKTSTIQDQTTSDEENLTAPTFPDRMLKEPIAEPSTNNKGEKSKWEIRRQFVFLTYPRCNLPVEQFVDSTTIPIDISLAARVTS